MKINKTTGKTLAAACAAIGILLNGAEAHANLEGRWIQHPAATLRSEAKQSQVDRIIEGNKYVYFSVRGAWLDRGDGGMINSYSSLFNLDPIQLFRFDKSLPWEDVNIRPLAQEFDLSGVLVETMNYSPKLGMLALVYENNSMDFIYDDGTLITSHALKDLAVPKQNAATYSITFDEEKPLAYVAGSFGYITVDLSNGELQDYVRTDKSVAWAGRVGNNMVLFAGDVQMPVKNVDGQGKTKYTTGDYSVQTYIYPYGKVPSTLETPVASEADLQALMPLSSDSFAALAPGASEAESTLKIFTVSDGSLTSRNVQTGLATDDASSYRYRHKFRTDGYVQNAREGYVIHSLDRIVLLDHDGNVTEIPKTSLSATERASKAATLDGSSVWLYTYDTTGHRDSNPQKRGFYSYKISGVTWGEKSAVASPSAPTMAFLNYGGYNEKYGMIFRSPSTLYETGDPDIDRIMGYKDGKWTDLSYSANNTKYAIPYKSCKEVVSDPANPDWIWGVMFRGGLIRMDLNDYSNFLGLGTPHYNSYKTTYPGYFPVFEQQVENVDIINFTNVDFDSNNTMWFGRQWFDNFVGDKELDYGSELVIYSYTPVFYLTEEDRKQIGAKGVNQDMIPDMKKRELRVPRAKLVSNPKLIAMKSPQNRNYIVATPNSYPGKNVYSFILDHNGTLDNPDDDRHILLSDLYDENGDRILYLNETGIYEDIVTGNLWLLTTSGPFLINPTEVLDGKKVCRRLEITRKDGRVVSENPLEFISVKNVNDDVLGRKWLATEEGLYCLSPDSQEVLGHYTVANSAIPSDNIFNAVCSPDGAVFVLTDRGVAEFHPEGSTTAVSAGSHLSIWPSSVTPDYRGYITISGAEEGSEYVLCNHEGKEIRTLGRAENGKFQWTVDDSQGKRIAPGRYNVKRRNVEESNPVIVLDK